MRAIPRCLRSLIGALAVLLVAPAGASAQDAAVRCDDDTAARPKAPVLLVHGTGVDAEVNWSWGYAKALRERGHGICTVDLPRRGAVDLQESVHVTVAGIREAARSGGGRRVGIIGHSQGASQAMLALRAWPALAALVEDVVGLAGVYDRGSEAIGAQCASEGCSAAFWQFASGSNLLRALVRHPLPGGLSFTAIGTLQDDTVTPQPAANELAGARSMQIQDVCPGRRFVPSMDHIYLAADAVGFALAVDALEHPGPADPARVAPETCLQQILPGADLVKLATLMPTIAAAFTSDGAAERVAAEPPVRCPLAEGCGASVRLTAVAGLRLLSTTVRPGGRLVLRVRARRPVTLRLQGLAGSVRVGRGRRTVVLLAPRRAGRYRTVVQVREGRRVPWVAAGVVRFTVRARH